MGRSESWLNRVVSFFEVKASKTCQQTLTNIRANSFKQENQTLSYHWFYSVSSHNAEPQIPQYSASSKCFITYLVRITVLSQLPQQTLLFSVTNEGTK